VCGTVCVCVCMHVTLFDTVNVYVCVHVCVFICTCAYMYMHVRICTYIHVYVYLYVSLYIYIYICTCLCVSVCASVCVCVCVEERAIPSYQKMTIFLKMREGIRAQFQWIRSWLVAPSPRGKRLGEHQRRTAWWTRHCRNAVQDHPWQTCFHESKTRRASPRFQFSLKSPRRILNKMAL